MDQELLQVQSQMDRAKYKFDAGSLHELKNKEQQLKGRLRRIKDQ